MKRLDFKAINAAAVVAIEDICRHWLPNGKMNGQEWEIGDRHGTPGKSLKIRLTGTKGGNWADFSTDDKGGDLISLVAYVEGCSQSDAAHKLTAFLGMDTALQSPSNQAEQKPTTKRNMATGSEWIPLQPVPDDAPVPPQAHRRNGKPDKIYPYRDQQGALLGYVWRWDATEQAKKEFTWLVYTENKGTGEKQWRWIGFPPPRPLWGLDLLPQHPQAPIIICEGEKATEAARVLLPDHVAMTWPGGGKAVSKADLGPLKGREVVLWEDADKPGKDAMQNAGKMIAAVDVSGLRKININALIKERNNPEKIDGLDAADLLEEGWNAERMAGFMRKAGSLQQVKSAVKNSVSRETTDNRKTEDRFSVNDSGLFYTPENGDIIRIADKLEVPALARDEESSGWSPVLAFKDMDGHQRKEIIPRKLFLGDGMDGPKQLADLGLYIEPASSALNRLKLYVAGQRPKKRARLVGATGWHHGAYLFPDHTIGATKEELIYRGSRRSHGIFTTSGTLEQWKEQVASLANNNRRLMFTISAALAGVLLHQRGAASFAIHWTGDSSIGKSGALAAGGSVWGHPQGVVHSWRSTDNSLEYVAAQHNDGLLILDELKEVDPKQAGAIAYMLSNAKGKNRAHHSGGLREAITWRIVMLSSGELGLADHMSSIGQKAHAGQAVRFIELSADAGVGHGMWDDPSRLGDGRSFTDHIKQAATKYHGAAAQAFIGALIKELPGALDQAQQIEKQFFDEATSATHGGQVKRVAASFAVIAAAGELAAMWGICPWPRSAAYGAALELFSEWASNRPTTGNLEEAQILDHVRHVLERNWQARFVDWKRATEDQADLSRMAAVHDTLGFRKRDELWKPETPHYLFYVTRGRFKDEFAAKGGFNPRRVAAVLKEHGILRCGEDSATFRESLPNGDARSYCIIGRKLWTSNGKNWGE